MVMRGERFAPRQETEPAVDRTTYDIRDAEGAIVFRATLETETKPFDLMEHERQSIYDSEPETTKLHRVTNLVLTSPDGKSTVRLSKFLPDIQSSILVPEKPLSNHCHLQTETDGRTLTVIPKPESVLDIAVAFHELGHEEQTRDPRFAAALEQCKIQLDSFSKPIYLGVVKEILDQDPGWDTRGILDASDREQIESLMARYVTYFDNEDRLDDRSDALLRKKDELEKTFYRDHAPIHASNIPSSCVFEWDPNRSRVIVHISDKAGNDVDPVVLLPSGDKEAFKSFSNESIRLKKGLDAIEAELDVARNEFEANLGAEIRQYLEKRGPAINEYFFRGRQVLERDATRRALVWLRTLKSKHGINALGASGDESETLQALNGFLETYSAGPGQMPPGSKMKPLVKNAARDKKTDADASYA